jgi:hypothetical protein
VALRFEPSPPGMTSPPRRRVTSRTMMRFGHDPSTGRFTINTDVLDWLCNVVLGDLQRRGLIPRVQKA